jgi:hypothetical protein
MNPSEQYDEKGLDLVVYKVVILVFGLAGRSVLSVKYVLSITPP